MKTIFFPHGETDLWNRVRRSLENCENRSEFRLIHLPETPGGALAVLQQSAPALLLACGGPAETPIAPLPDLISSDTLYILMVFEATDESIYGRCLSQGYRGIIDKNACDQMLLKAIQSVFAGELWFPRDVLAGFVRNSLRNSSPALTSRESEILNLIGLGFKNQQIADRLFISRETVRWHIRALYSKLGATHRPGALKYSRYPGRRMRSHPGQNPI